MCDGGARGAHRRWRPQYGISPAAPSRLGWPAMLGLRGIVLVALGAFGAVFSGAWARNLLRLHRQPPEPRTDTVVGPPSPVHIGIGFVTNFFDYLGIGSFATTTA